MNSLPCHLNQQRSRDMHLELFGRNVFFSFLWSIFYWWINKFCIEIVTEEVFFISGQRLIIAVFCVWIIYAWVQMYWNAYASFYYDFSSTWFMLVGLNVIIWESIWNLGHGFGVWLWKKWCSVAIIFSIISWRNVSEIYWFMLEFSFLIWPLFFYMV